MARAIEAKIGLLGHPVDHSLSPEIHNFWIEDDNRKAHYDLIDCPAEALEATVKTLKKEYRGWNITIPHKQSIIPYLDRLSPAAKAIGAVNTVYQKKGQWIGHNTDYLGIIKTLEPYCEQKPEKALIIGAGGAARACAYALLEMGIKEIAITNRTKTKAEVIANDFTLAEHIDWDKADQNLADYNLICQMSAAGLKGYDNLPFSLKKLSENCICFDAVYNPLETDFLKQAQKAGATPIDGLQMLIYQAAFAYECWFDQYPTKIGPLYQRLKERFI